MFSRISLTIACCLFVIFCLACGQTYETQSIAMDPSSPNVVGIGGWQQMTVTANMSNSKTQDVTNRSTYAITAPGAVPPGVYTPPDALIISATGRIQAVGAACTWSSTMTTDTPPKKVFATTPYVLTATWDNHQAIAFISVNSGSPCDAPTTTGGTAPGPIVFNVAPQYRYLLNADGTLRSMK